MLNINEIKNTSVEKFSTTRKHVLQTIVQLKLVDLVTMKWMIKHTEGSLKKGLLKYKISSKNIEEACDLAKTLAIDENELKEVELALVRSLTTLNA